MSTPLLPLRINQSYRTMTGALLHVESVVRNDYVGRTHKLQNGLTEFRPEPYFRCRFAATGEVVFYDGGGHLLEHSGKNESIQKLA